MKKLFALGFVGAMTLSGCTQGLLTSVLNQALANGAAGQQSANAKPAAQTSPAAPGATPSGDLFGVGRKWTYAYTSSVLGQNLTGEMTLEVVSVDGDNAQVKSTVTMAGVSTSNTTTVNKKNANPWASLNLGAGGASGGAGASAGVDESVTVQAGSYSAKHFTYTSGTANGGSGAVDIWLSPTVGLVKEVVKTQVGAGATAGAGAGAAAAAAAAGLNVGTTTTIELKSVS